MNIIPVILAIACVIAAFVIGRIDGYEAGWISADSLAEKYNGWLTRPIKHFICGMIHGHEWKDETPLLDQGIKHQVCKWCGKERMV